MTPPTDQTPGARHPGYRYQRTRRVPKWHIVYSLLALFDVLVVGTGLIYVHRIVQSYHRSVSTKIGRAHV